MKSTAAVPHHPTRLPHAGLVGPLLEPVAAGVDVERITGAWYVGEALEGEYGRDVPVQQSVVVEVADGASHAIVIPPGTGLKRQVGESAVTIVVVVTAGAVVGGH